MHNGIQGKWAQQVRRSLLVNDLEPVLCANDVSEGEVDWDTVVTTADIIFEPCLPARVAPLQRIRIRDVASPPFGVQ